jgi:hypothetical protein
MGLIELIIVLAVLGCAWMLFNRYVPAPEPVKTIVGVVVAVVMIVILLQWLLPFAGLHGRL